MDRILSTYSGSRIEIVQQSCREDDREKTGSENSYGIFVGDEVLVRLPDIRSGRRRKQKFFRLLTSLRGHVIEADPNRYRYRVEYDSSDGPINRWFSVNDITSPTMQTERERNTSRASKCLMYSSFCLIRNYL